MRKAFLCGLLSIPRSLLATLITLVFIGQEAKGYTGLNDLQKPSSAGLTASSHASSYCESETFRAQCWPGHVIMMTSALYGRMRLGRCVEADLGYLGCKQSVLELTDRKCSGRQDCEIRIPDAELDQTRPCYKELKVYLEADYACMRVLPADQQCSVPVHTHPSHLSSLTPTQQGCGSRTHPWVLHVDPGQRINLTLTDFSAGSALIPPSADPPPSQNAPRKDASTTGCTPYGYILETVAGEMKNLTICGGTGTRQTFLYRSETDTVKVFFFQQAGDAKQQQQQQQNAAAAGSGTGANFLIGFHSVGCADLRLLRDAWMKRSETEAVVGCNSTRQTWHLQCQGTQWVGVIGNCTQHALIIVIVAISLALCLLIVGIGLACLRSAWLKPTSTPHDNKPRINYDNVKTYEDCRMIGTEPRSSGAYRQKSLPALPSAHDGYMVSHVLQGVTDDSTQFALPDDYLQGEGYATDAFCAGYLPAMSGFDAGAHITPAVVGNGIAGQKFQDCGGLKIGTVSGGYFALEREQKL